MDPPALAGLDDANRRRLLAAARRRTFTRREVVFHAGDPANSLHFLVSGRVSVHVTTPSGDTAILAVLGPGAVFGELALLADTERSATIQALEPVVTFALTKTQLVELRAMSPEVDRFLIGMLVNYIHRQDARLIEALFVSAEKRVLRRLLDLGREYGGGRPGTVVPLTQDTLASMAGTTRPTANQVLRRAEQAGLITIDRARIRINDPEALARLGS